MLSKARATNSIDVQRKSLAARGPATAKSSLAKRRKAKDLHRTARKRKGKVKQGEALVGKGDEM